MRIITATLHLPCIPPADFDTDLLAIAIVRTHREFASQRHVRGSLKGIDYDITYDPTESHAEWSLVPKDDSRSWTRPPTEIRWH